MSTTLLRFKFQNATEVWELFKTFDFKGLLLLKIKRSTCSKSSDIIEVTFIKSEYIHLAMYPLLKFHKTVN